MQIGSATNRTSMWQHSSLWRIHPLLSFVEGSHERVTIDGFWIDDWIYGTLIQLVTTPHKSLLHTGQCSQSRSSVTASNSRRSSASRLMSLQAGDHLTPASYPHCELSTATYGCCLSAVAHSLTNWPRLTPTLRPKLSSL
jgi:hypothetical protein